MSRIKKKHIRSEPDLVLFVRKNYGTLKQCTDEERYKKH